MEKRRERLQACHQHIVVTVTVSERIAVVNKK
jgi:hypothetical protein